MICYFGTSSIHPAYLTGERPLSRSSTIIWPPYLRPPKRKWGLWGQFLRYHVEPLLSNIIPNWSPHLYQKDTESLTCFHIKRRQKVHLRHLTTTYHIYVTYFFLHWLLPSWRAPTQRQYLFSGFFPTTHTNETKKHPSKSLQKAFYRLPPSLRHISGNVKFPTDNGISLIQAIQQSTWRALYGSSDATLKSQCSTHAWIISSSQTDDISNRDKNISGAGPIDGLPSYLSSSRAELTGLTALVIIANLFMDFHNTKTSFYASCDNHGMIKKCSLYPSNRLRLRREKNSDLFLVHRIYSKKKLKQTTMG